MAPTKNVYVKEEDLEMWQRAEKLAPDSVSALVSRLLREWVENREKTVDPQGMGRIVVSHHLDDDGTVVKKAFRGRMLLSDFASDYPGDAWQFVGGRFCNHNTWFAAATASGSYVVWTVDDQGNREHFETYDSIDDMEDEGREVPSDVIAAIASAAGEEYVQELDI